MKLSCQQCRELLASEAENPGGVSADVASHLESCADCAQFSQIEYSMLRQVVGELRALPILRAPDDLRSRIQAQIAQEQPEKVAPTQIAPEKSPRKIAPETPRFRWKMPTPIIPRWATYGLPPVAVAACLMLLLARDPNPSVFPIAQDAAPASSAPASSAPASSAPASSDSDSNRTDSNSLLAKSGRTAQNQVEKAAARARSNQTSPKKATSSTRPNAAPQNTQRAETAPAADNSASSALDSSARSSAPEPAPELSTSSPTFEQRVAPPVAPKTRNVRPNAIFPNGIPSNGSRSGQSAPLSTPPRQKLSNDQSGASSSDTNRRLFARLEKTSASLLKRSGTANTILREDARAMETNANASRIFVAPAQSGDDSSPGNRSAISPMSRNDGILSDSASGDSASDNSTSGDSASGDSTLNNSAPSVVDSSAAETASRDGARATNKTDDQIHFYAGSPKANTAQANTAQANTAQANTAQANTANASAAKTPSTTRRAAKPAAPIVAPQSVPTTIAPLPSISNGALPNLSNDATPNSSESARSAQNGSSVAAAAPKTQVKMPTSKMSTSNSHTSSTRSSPNSRATLFLTLPKTGARLRVLLSWKNAPRNASPQIVWSGRGARGQQLQLQIAIPATENFAQKSARNKKWRAQVSVQEAAAVRNSSRLDWKTLAREDVSLLVR